jgi:hypothetical protein
MPKIQTTPRGTHRDGHTKVLRFERVRTLEQTKGGVVEVYEVVCGEQSFGYLYVTSDRYSLVWQGAESFEFDMPYSLIEHQFSGKPPSRIRDLRPLFPFRREKKDFSYHRATASVFLQGEETAQEFDLLDERTKMKYSELIDQQPALTSRIGFARYDSEIEILTEGFEVCFTAERLNQDPGDNWEYVISLPRKVVLKPLSLRWVVEKHKLRELDQGINYRASIAGLSDLLYQ